MEQNWVMWLLGVGIGFLGLLNTWLLFLMNQNARARITEREDDRKKFETIFRVLDSKLARDDYFRDRDDSKEISRIERKDWKDELERLRRAIETKEITVVLKCPIHDGDNK